MFRIGSLSFNSPLVLAPLAGYSDLPFRLLCRQFGAGLTVSEMISCHGLIYKQEKTLAMLQSVQQEQPVSFQLFGSDPDVMADAAEIMAGHGSQIIDINMGCPVRKVTKKGAGAALMSQPKIAEEIATKIVDRVSLPVTAKIRAGVNENLKNGVEFAKMLENTGVAAITIHGRTWSQQFTGKADRGAVQQVKNAVNIPVIGNGDILSHSQAYEMMEQTGCDAVMIGRAALGNPWVFRETGRPTQASAVAEVALLHLSLIKEYLPAHRILGYIKNQMSRYFKGLPGSSRMRCQIFATTTLPELEDFLIAISENI